MKRIVLKLSGEALAIKDSNGKVKEIFDPDFVDSVAAAIKKCVDAGNQIALVVGAGNIWRGRAGGEMDRTEADRMGMLATVINAICLKDALVRQGAEAVVMTSVAMPPFADPYSSQSAVAALEQGKIVIFGAGLGIPFLFSAVLIDSLKNTFNFIKRNYKTVNLVSGSLLILVGILMATGQLGRWLAVLQ